MILFIIPGIYTGGAERVVARMANRWVEQGKKVGILTFDSPDLPHYPLSPDILLIRTGIYKPSKNKLEAVLNNIYRVSVLRGHLKRLQPDTVYCFTEDANVLGSLAAIGKRHFRLVLADRVNPAEFGLNKIWKFLKKIVYPIADVLVVQTQSVRGMYPHFKIPIVVINNPLPKPTTTVQDYESRRIVAVGRLTAQKNFDLLIRAFANVQAPDWQLHIIGEGDDRSELARLISDNNLNSRVLLRGRSDTVFQELAAASVFVLSSRGEGYPNALIEAMGVGLACVSTDCPSGPNEIIQEGLNGLLVPNEDQEALTQAIQKLVNSKDLRQKLGNKAQDIVAHLDLDTILKQWETLGIPAK